VVFDIETSGLNPWYGDRITCICAKDSDKFEFQMVGNGENKLIDSFLRWINQRKSKKYFIITKNGKQFDIPFILTRLVLNAGINLEEGLFILDYPHFDFQEIIDRPISLNNMAKLLKCSKKTGTSWSAIKLWEEKRFDELKAYCINDVEITEQIFLKWINLR